MCAHHPPRLQVGPIAGGLIGALLYEYVFLSKDALGPNTLEAQYRANPKVPVGYVNRFADRRASMRGEVSRERSDSHSSERVGLVAQSTSPYVVHTD